MESNYFGRKIKDLRIKKGISQEEMAKKIGMAPPQLSKYESGCHMPNLEKIIKISRVLGVSIDYLISEVQQETVTVDSPDLQVIQDVASGLDAKSRREVLMLALQLRQASEQNDQ